MYYNSMKCEFRHYNIYYGGPSEMCVWNIILSRINFYEEKKKLVFVISLHIWNIAIF